MLGLPGIYCRNDALAMVRSLMDFPPAPDSSQFAAWHARINVFLEYSRTRSDAPRTRSKSGQSPAQRAATAAVAVGGAARPAPALAPGAAARPGEDPHVSVGSSTSSPEPRDAREIIRERRVKDGRVTIEPLRDRQRRHANEVDAHAAGTGAVDYGGGCLALKPSLRQVNWLSKF